MRQNPQKSIENRAERVAESFPDANAAGGACSRRRSGAVAVSSKDAADSHGACRRFICRIAACERAARSRADLERTARRGACGGECFRNALRGKGADVCPATHRKYGTRNRRRRRRIAARTTSIRTGSANGDRSHHASRRQCRARVGNPTHNRLRGRSGKHRRHNAHLAAQSRRARLVQLCTGRLQFRGYRRLPHVSFRNVLSRCEPCLA